ncbi:glycosyltransferase [Mammaliicoccus sciuri]|nr:glycosyltransferase [Mammaliicoccus sciuri]MBU6087730.1 glycosyltransferase [Mammaliicoccus sciuri]MBW3108710.1 glycosyltransferase [Mammaliicoccus sciuri]
MNKEFQNLIFSPLRVNLNQINSKYQIYAPKIITKKDSVFSILRRNKSFNYLKNNINFNKVKLVHAHSLTNDGLLANMIYEKYKIPFILTIRNTDVNFSFKYKKHLKKAYKKSIINSSLIIFPNYSYKKRVIEFFKNDVQILNKINDSIVIPNGIDNFWHENKKVKKKKKPEFKKLNLLFIGRIYKEKNIHRILEAIKKINQENQIYVTLTIIGEVIDKQYFNKIKDIYKFNYLGKLDKYEIVKVMEQNDIFIMPSINETFGLVFIEALSQNLPIIYTKNEGIDGYFKNKFFGERAIPKSIESISNSIMDTYKNYDQYQENLENKEFLDNFKWQEISSKYNLIYKQTINLDKNK